MALSCRCCQNDSIDRTCGEYPSGVSNDYWFKILSAVCLGGTLGPGAVTTQVVLGRSGWRPPTRDDLRVSGSEGVSLERLLARLEELESRAVARELENAELRAENAELKRRLGRNSRNSSLSPSTDGPERAVPPRSLRGKSGRGPGKQPGAQGFSLELVGDPDEIVDHVPNRCRGCVGDLDGAAPAGVVRRQVTDITPAVATVIEHRLHRRRCGAGWSPPRRPRPVSRRRRPRMGRTCERGWCTRWCSGTSRSPGSSSSSPISRAPARRPAGSARCCWTPHPRLRLHRPQTRHQRLRSNPHRRHRKPLDTNTFTSHVNSCPVRMPRRDWRIAKAVPGCLRGIRTIR
ncbi:DUF6444 domain-containing protein [Actinokineospora sp. NBRC 105648]|uniref:DUF6444 domain-containing protein n=1 Tax=Actinokineospora sp. NBRC 105648 TaxID=3032206 RepID=UPI0033222855